MDISDFFKRTKQSYVGLLIGANILEEADRAIATERLQRCRHGIFAEQEEIHGLQAEVTREENEEGELEPVVLTTKDVEALINSKSDYNDPELDGIRQTLFHEFSHVLQMDSELSQDVGFVKSSMEGNALNEVAASVIEQATAVQYLKSVRGLQNAGIGQIRTGNNGEYTATMVQPDMTQFDPTKPIKAGTYYREVSLIRQICDKIGVSMNDLASASFDFHQLKREDIIDKFEANDLFFDAVATNLNIVMVYNSRQSADDMAVTEEQYNEALKALKDYGATTLEQAAENSTPVDTNSFQINEFGEVVRGDGEPTQAAVNADIPTFTPPTTPAPEPTPTPTPAKPQQSNSNVSKIDPEELRKLREEMGIGQEPQADTHYVKNDQPEF